MKSWKNWLLLAAALAFSNIVGEVLVRAFAGGSVVLFPRYHAEAHYGDYTLRRLRPETIFWHTSADGSWEFIVNRQGFRARHDFAYERNDGILRIMVLGDSHTQGFEARQDYIYPTIIENYLNNHGIAAEVMNTGISGFGTAEEFVFIELEAIKYHPDVIVLGFFANDFADSVKSDLFRLSDGGLNVQSIYHAPGVGIMRLHNSIGPLRWLSENSYLYSILVNAVWEIAKGALLSQKKRKLVEEFAIQTQDVGDYEKKVVTELVSRMSEVCRDNGILFVILDIPQATTPGDFRASLPADLEDAFERDSDALIRSEDVLSAYRGLVEFHVPHGQAHISEVSHFLLGVEAAKTIQQLVAGRSGEAGVALNRTNRSGSSSFKDKGGSRS